MTSSIRRGTYTSKCHRIHCEIEERKVITKPSTMTSWYVKESTTNNHGLLPYTLETRVPFNPFISTKQIGVIPLLYWELNFT